MVRKTLQSYAAKLRLAFNATPGKDVFSGMAMLALGSVAARLISIISIPILTRLYSPEDFGVLAIFTSLILILAPISTLRYVLAIPLPQQDRIAANLFVLSAILMLLISVILSVLLWLYGEYIFLALSIEQLTAYWWLIAIGLVGVASYELLTLWGTRKKAYKPIAQTSAIQSIMGNTTKIILGLLAIKPLGLLIGQIVFTSGGTSFLYHRFKPELSSNYRFIKTKNLCAVARRYKHFPFYRLPSQVLLVFSTQAPVLFFAATYTTALTGQLSMALVIIALPITILGKSMSNAYYAEGASIGAKDPVKLRLVTKDVVAKLLYISIIPAIVLFIWGPAIFSLILGPTWIQAGEFASLLSFYLISQFVAAPIVTAFNIIEKNAFFLVLNIIRASSLFLILYLTPRFLNLSANTTILIYSIFMSLFYICIYFFIMTYLNKLAQNKAGKGSKNGN